MPSKSRKAGDTGQARPQNIQELARIAGVSAATVSRALAGSGKISPATRERIRKLADQLGFRPSSMARNLRTGRTGTIGVIVPLWHEKTQHISDPFFMTPTGWPTAATTCCSAGWCPTIPSGFRARSTPGGSTA